MHSPLYTDFNVREFQKGRFCEQVVGLYIKIYIFVKRLQNSFIWDTLYNNVLNYWKENI